MTPAYCPKCGSPWFKLKAESHSRPARFVSKPNTRVDIFLELYYRCDVCHWEWWEFPHEPTVTADIQKKGADMFKFKIGQHVWFLVGPMGEDEDPEYLEGDITRQYVDDDHHGSPDALYEIQTADGIYDREESGLYASFDELSTAVTEDLQYWVDHARQRVKEIKEELDEAWADREAAKQRLARWAERLKKGS